MLNFNNLSNSFLVLLNVDFSLEQEVMERTLAQEIEDARVADTAV